MLFKTQEVGAGCKLSFLILGAFAALGLSACQTESKTADPRSMLTDEVRHVVLIGIDGLSPDGVNNADTPVLDRLMREGAYTMNARSVLPTSSSTNWKSMVSGAGPEQHGVTSNGWEKDDFVLPPVSHGLEEMFPTMFGQFRQQRSGASIGAVYAWEGFGRLIEKTSLNYDVGGQGDQETVELAARYLESEKPELLFVHLDGLDHVGHRDGHKTAAYYAAVEQADRQIGSLVDAAESSGISSETVFIITSDHGGIGYGHGGETLDEIEIPFIVYGAAVKPGHLIRQYVYTYDTAATVAFLLDFKPHGSWTGKVIKSAFSGIPAPEVDASQGSAAGNIPAPTLYPKAELYAPPGGLYVDEPAILQISSEVDNAEIRYTTDGSEPSDTSTLYSEPVELTKSTLIKAKAFLANGVQSNAAVGYYHLVESQSANGINYQYFEGDDWSFLPAYDSLEPKMGGETYQFRINDIPQRDYGFGIRYTAWLEVAVAGTHKFYTNSDDGSKLYINGQQIVNNDGEHGTIERSGTVELSEGLHEISVEYFNAGGGFWLEVFHKAPGTAKQLIDPGKLYLQSPGS